MKKNMGGIDRVLRLIIGIAIAAAGVVYQSWFGLIALIPLGTAAISICPLYLPLGMSTRSSEEGSAEA
ncbi:MAG: DUF2892 domain-containing protein [bacterium]|nr:DUF2892 domain-containing protein [bacterium]